MANKFKRVIMLIRDDHEDDGMSEIWKAISLLHDDYLRCAFLVRNRRRKNTKNRNVVRQGSIPAPPRPSPVPPVVRSTTPNITVAAPPPQPIKTKELSPQRNAPVVVKKTISPMLIDEPPKADPPRSGQPSPLKRSFSQIRKEEKGPSPPTKIPKFSSVRNNNTARSCVSNRPVVTKHTVTSGPPVPSPASTTKKLLDDERLTWIVRRDYLIDRGVDLTVITLGDPDKTDWTGNCLLGGKRLYVVWRGKRVGAFVGWDLTSSLIKGFPGAGYLRVYSEAEAIDVLTKKYHEGALVV